MISAKDYKLATGLIAFTWNAIQLIEMAYLDRRIYTTCCLFVCFFVLVQQLTLAQGFLILEVFRSHTTTHHSL